MPDFAPIPEMERRLLFTLLKPAMKLASRLGLPLALMESISRLAYYEVVREDLTQAQIAQLFGTSRRTVVNVEALRRTDILAPQAETDIARRIWEVLAPGPLALDEIAVRLSVEAPAVESVLRGIGATGRATRLADGRWQLEDRFESLVSEDIGPRLAGLDHQLEAVTAAVHARFLGRSGASVARTLSFLGRDDDVAKMADGVVQVIRSGAVDSEERALRAGVDRRYMTTFVVAPVDD